HEQPRRVHEREDQEQDRMHGVLGGDDHEGRRHENPDRKSVVEGKSGDLGGTGVQTCARPICTNSPAAFTNARIRNRTECTGFLAAMTMKADATRTQIGRASWRERVEISVGLEFRRVLVRSARTAPPRSRTRGSGTGPNARGSWRR